MIINIPLQIDEQRMEEVLARDYENKITKEILSCLNKVLSSRSGRYTTNPTVDGMQEFVKETINDFFETHKDEVIEAAAEAFAIKLARSKRGKELLG